MTVVAGGRRQILLFIYGFGVHTGLVFLILIARNSEGAHVIGARVTLRASLGDVRRINGREGISGRANAVHAVTTDAGCNSRFTFFF